MDRGRVKRVLIVLVLSTSSLLLAYCGNLEEPLAPSESPTPTPLVATFTPVPPMPTSIPTPAFDYETAILHALNSTKYSPDLPQSLWEEAMLTMESAFEPDPEVYWDIETRDPDRVVWTVTFWTTMTILSETGKDMVKVEAYRYFIDLEDWVAELDFTTVTGEVKARFKEYNAFRWDLVGERPPLP